MSSNLRKTITDLAATFATGVLDAIRGASLEEILAETGRRGGVPVRGRAGAASAVGAAAAVIERRVGRRGERLHRRSAEDIAELVEKIIGLLSSSPDGLRAEQIRDALGLEAKELPRPLSEALRSKRVVKKGQKRATTYFLKEGGRASTPSRGAKASRGAARANGAAKAGRKAGRGKGRGRKGQGGEAATAADA